MGWSTWKKLGGTTDVSLAPVAFGNKLYLFSKGIVDKKIYVSSSANGNSWSTWKEFGGTTDVSLAPVAFGNKLYLFSKGIVDKKVYWSSSADGNNWSTWKEFGGTTDAAVRAVSYGRDLYVLAKGLVDKRIYVISGGEASAWSAWYEVPPRQLTTNAAVAAVKFSDRIFLFAKGEDDHIYMQSLAIYPLPFDGAGWTLGKGNWDDPGAGHGEGQEYAFDFDHTIGANVRAARGGEVVFVENNDGNSTIDATVPGYGTAILIRHSDNTAAAYDHLQFLSTKVVLHEEVQQGQVIALSGNTGNSFGPHLHFDERQYWNSPSDMGPTIPIYFKDANHAAWRPKTGDALVP